MEQKLSAIVNITLEQAKTNRLAQPRATDNWPHEFNLDSEPEQKDLGFNFMTKSLNKTRQKDKRLKMDVPKDEVVFIDGPMELEENSDASVYDTSNESVDRKLESHLRASKLTKVICKHKRIGPKKRQELKIRRNIIKFRMRKSNQQLLDELTYKLIPKT